MHDGMPYGRNQGQGQGHSREVDRQSPTGLIFILVYYHVADTKKSAILSLTNIFLSERHIGCDFRTKKVKT